MTDPRKLVGRSQRSPAQHYVKGNPLSYREALEALYLADPTVDVIEASRRTGAPRSAAATVKRRLRDAGKIPAPRVGGPRQ